MDEKTRVRACIEEADTPQMILERDTHLAALAHLQAMAEENERLRGEVDGLSVMLHTTLESRNTLVEDNRQAEAEVKSLKEEISGNDSAHRLALADLARWQPLIEAAEGLLAFIREKFPKDFEPGGQGYLCPHHKAIAAALSCRESSESSIVSRGKADILGERKGKPVICPENGPSPGPEPTRRQR